MCLLFEISCTFFLRLSAKTVQTKFDAKTLHSNQSLAAETQMVDDGTGDVEVGVCPIVCYIITFLGMVI